mgnify:FL=1|jgi:hypothetical protein
MSKDEIKDLEFDVDSIDSLEVIRVNDKSEYQLVFKLEKGEHYQDIEFSVGEDGKSLRIFVK